MKIIKLVDAKTEKLQRAISLLNSYKNKASLSSIKEQAEFAKLKLEGRTFKAVYPQLVEFYNKALKEEERKLGGITTEASDLLLKQTRQLEAETLDREDIKHIYGTKNILTIEEIDRLTSRLRGSHIKKGNARIRLVKESNKLAYEEIETIKNKIKILRLEGAKEQDLRKWYAEITKLELAVLKNVSCNNISRKYVREVMI